MLDNLNVVSTNHNIILLDCVSTVDFYQDDTCTNGLFNYFLFIHFSKGE